MQETVYFTNTKGNRLCAIMSDAADNKEKSVIILCHGFRSSKSSKTYESLEEIFNKANLSTFRFDFFGHGDSEGKFEDITISEAVDDILNAIKFAKKLGYKKIGLVGSSFGGIAALMAASKTKELYALALKSPVSDFEELLRMENTNEQLKEWKKKGYSDYTGSDKSSHKLKYSFFEDTKKNIAYKVAKNIKIPVLIVHGTKDKAVPLPQSKKTSKLIKNCRLVVIKGADHRYTNEKDFDKMIELISGFIVGKS